MIDYKRKIIFLCYFTNTKLKKKNTSLIHTHDIALVLYIYIYIHNFLQTIITI